MMAHARSRGRARRPGNNMPHNGWLIFSRPEQHWLFRLLGMLIRARAELTLITVTVTLYAQLDNYYAPDTILIGTGVVTIAVLAIPVTRRYVWRRLWCVITRRRLRACMVQTFTMARANGRLPFLLWARPSPVGEHVLVWLPAGMAVKDLDRITAELAAACWAKDTRIVPSKRRAFFAHIHVIRRDTLGTVDLSPQVIDELDHQPEPSTSSRKADARPAYPYLVRDPQQDRAGLAALTPSINRTPTTAAPAASSNDSPAGTSSTTAGSTSKASTGKPTTALSSDEDDDPAVTGYGGLDVSDYV